MAVCNKESYNKSKHTNKPLFVFYHVISKTKGMVVLA